jgi:hypothetical protein
MREKKQSGKDPRKITILHRELLQFRFRFGIINTESKSVTGLVWRLI